MGEQRFKKLLYTKRRGTKTILLILAIFLGVSLFLWPYLKNLQSRASLTKEGDSKETSILDLKNISSKEVVGPKFLSLDNNSQPYSVEADRGVKEGDEHVMLESLTSNMKMEDGTDVLLHADKGQFNHALRDEAHLSGKVNLLHAKGYTLNTESAHVNFKSGHISGEEPVNGISEEGSLRGEGFEVDRQNSHLILKGKSHVTLYS